MPVDTTKAPRRELSFTCLDCLKDELDRIDAAHKAHTLRNTGNWTPGEILDHCARVMEQGLDGASKKAPLIARFFGRLMKGTMLKPRTMKAGYKLPAGAAEILPSPGASFETGMAHMRRALARIDKGERMTKPSAWLGEMTHEQWVRLNLNHTQLHLGFLAY